MIEKARFSKRNPVVIIKRLNFKIQVVFPAAIEEMCEQNFTSINGRLESRELKKYKPKKIDLETDFEIFVLSFQKESRVYVVTQIRILLPLFHLWAQDLIMLTAKHVFATSNSYSGSWQEDILHLEINSLKRRSICFE